VLEFLPAVNESERFVIWEEGSKGVHFCYEDGRLILLYLDHEAVTLMPDGSLYVKDPSRVLFDIPAPTLSMRRGGWRSEESNPLDRFAAPPDPSDDFGAYSYWGRHPEHERFECEDYDKGFCWELDVHDLRQCLDARIARVHRSLWRREVRGLTVELQAGVKLKASPKVVEPASDGSTLPRKGERVRVVLNHEGSIDRIWLPFRR
jgi:hypothetical protein